VSSFEKKPYQVDWGAECNWLCQVVSPKEFGDSGEERTTTPRQGAKGGILGGGGR